MHASDPVNRIMSEPVLTIGPEDSVRELLNIFIAYPVHHLPVVKDRQVVGMLSSADLMKLEFFLPPPGQAREALLSDSLSDRFRVNKVMRTPVVTIAEHETIQRAAELMAKNGFHSLPVVNSQDHLIGIVTTTDLMNGFLRSNSHSASGGESEHVHAIDVRSAEVVAKAREAVDTNTDPQGIAAAFLRSLHRLSALESVVHIAKRFLNAGQDERLHIALQKAIERADKLEQKTGNQSMIGLDVGE